MNGAQCGRQDPYLKERTGFLSSIFTRTASRQESCLEEEEMEQLTDLQYLVGLHPVADGRTDERP